MRRLAVAVLLACAVPCPGHAGDVVLAWDSPRDQQHSVQFILRMVTAQAGVTTAREQPLTLFSPAACAQWPDPARTAESLCAQICLEPGDYTLTVSVRRGAERSDESNLLDLDLKTTAPCQGAFPAPARPPVAEAPPSSRPPDAGGVSGGVVGGAIGGAISGGASGVHSGAPSWTALVNLQCVHWRIEGPCVCNPFTPCVQVSYWEPGWLVETVKRPGTTTLPGLQTILHGALSLFGAPALGGGGAGNATGSGHTNLHYNEVHVYAFPQLLGGPCTSCTPGHIPLTLHYASEVDPTWRTATAVPSPLSLLQRIGVWAPLYPRGGKAIHSSEPVGSGIAVARAMSIAHQPIGAPPNVDTHVVLQPTMGTSTCLQLAHPRRTQCLDAGTPPPLWEHATVSPSGTYDWVVWRKRSCCVNPTQTTCGITLPGVGGYGANMCLLPSTP